ncbi:hypothetical protein SAMN06265220_103375 [Flavobacterium nitrogenifigens]|uniref:Uncharacterized protein n=1 Tax=Flavobacterium nitrogenifigens TaxID=1617283 RepID=A0A521DU03_9FLAO|nr:hypothetical protein SAMN06265220_103375 [Flavobacterium nitrogenifigens]
MKLSISTFFEPLAGDSSAESSGCVYIFMKL